MRDGKIVRDEGREGKRRRVLRDDRRKFRRIEQLTQGK